MYFDGSLMLDDVGPGCCSYRRAETSSITSFSSNFGPLTMSPSMKHSSTTCARRLLSGCVASMSTETVHDMRAAAALRARSLYVHGDSELVINEVMKESTCRDKKMEAY